MAAERVNYKAFVYWVLAMVFYYCWFQAFYNSLKYDAVFPYGTLSNAVVPVLNNFLAIAIVFLLNWLTVFKIVRNRNIKIKIILDFCLSFLFVISINLLYVTIHSLYRTVTIDWAGTILNNILIFLCVEGVYYFKNYNKSRQEADDAHKKALQYKYDALKAQINPHFLFNSLSLLSSLVTIDQEKSKEFIQGLASMYRYIMARDGEETASVKKEMDFLRSYVSVLEMRYNNKFSVIIEGDINDDALVIPYTMQLLIENVTKHNVISKNYPMTVTVKMKPDGIEVSNPIKLRPMPTSGGIGLNYLKELYATYDKNFRTEIKNEEFTAYIPYLTQ